MELVRQWLELNREAIRAYWDGDLLTDEVIARIATGALRALAMTLRGRRAGPGTDPEKVGKGVSQGKRC